MSFFNQVKNTLDISKSSTLDSWVLLTLVKKVYSFKDQLKVL